MRIAITGATGLLGRALLGQAAERHQIVAAYHSQENLDHGYLEQYPLDLADESSTRRFVDSAAADLVIHCAAVTDVDLCEREPKLPQLLNADGTRRLVEAIKGTSARMVYISTDYVFDGTAGPYSETDPTNPINLYGKTKLEGELAVQSLRERAAIVRSSSFLGHGAGGRQSFVERMLDSLLNRPPLAAATNQKSNITPVDELADGIMRLIEAGASGIWHIAHPEVLSRYELAELIAECAGIDRSRILAVEYASLDRVAARPLNGGLKTEKATRDLAIAFRPLRDSIRTFLQES